MGTWSIVHKCKSQVSNDKESTSILSLLKSMLVDIFLSYHLRAQTFIFTLKKLFQWVGLSLTMNLAWWISFDLEKNYVGPEASISHFQQSLWLESLTDCKNSFKLVH